MADEEPKSNVIRLTGRTITSADLGEPTDMTKLSLAELVDGIDAEDFEGQGGPLKNCVHWLELKRRLNLRTGRR